MIRSNLNLFRVSARGISSTHHSKPDVMQNYENYSETDADPGDLGGGTYFAAVIESASPVIETDVVFVSVP